MQKSQAVERGISFPSSWVDGSTKALEGHSRKRQMVEAISPDTPE